MKPGWKTRQAGSAGTCRMSIGVVLVTLALAVLCLPSLTYATPIGMMSVGQKTGDFSLGFGFGYRMRRIISSSSPDTDLSSKGFSIIARYNIISQLSIYADGGFDDIWIDTPDFKGYLGGAYGGGFRLSLPDPHRSRFTVNINADVHNTQSGNGIRNATDFEYGGAVYAAFKNLNTITYGGIEASNVNLSFTNPNVTYTSKYNIGGIFGIDQFITPYVYFNFEIHVFDEESIEGNVAYTFF